VGRSLVAVLGGQANVEMLNGPVARPVGNIQDDRPDAGRLVDHRPDGGDLPRPS
jgi:hypothetical protein